MKENDASVTEFLENIDHPDKKEEAYQLLEIFQEVSGYAPKMWGGEHYRFRQVSLYIREWSFGSGASCRFFPAEDEI